MDPRSSAQDVVRCTLCQTSIGTMCCEVCHTNLCSDCVEVHFSDSSKVHNVVPLKQNLSTLNYPKCKKHPNKQCELHCEQCDIPICAKCISSEEHVEHSLVDILKAFESKRKSIGRDLHELEVSILPRYQDIASYIQEQRADLDTMSMNLTKALKERKQDWYRNIKTIMKSLKSDLNKMELKLKAAIDQQQDKMTTNISLVSKSIDDLKKIMNSNDVCLVSEYQSRNAEFRRLPPKLKVSLPNFTCQKIKQVQFSELFGSLSGFTYTTEKQSPLTDMSLLDVPEVISTIDTQFEDLRSVACQNDKKIWTCGEGKIIKLFNLQGELMNTIKSKSVDTPLSIAVTRSGDLVYTDCKERTVNLVRNMQMKEMIRLRGWIPRNVCRTTCSDLLVLMDSDDDKQAKIVRYAGFSTGWMMKQRIQFNDEGQPLYSYGGTKYICENKNQDICVSDNNALAVIVVNQAGEFRFQYTGIPNKTNGLFKPCGIATDSQSRILVADIDNDRIHILDRDGEFIRFVHCLDFFAPCGISVDSKDNLFVAENSTGNVKKVRYSL